MPNEKLREYALAFLRQHVSAVLATSSPDGEPQAATLYYDVDDDFNFYFVSSKETLKVKNLLVNKRASFVVGFGPRVCTIQGQGDAEIIDDVDFRLFGKIVEKINLYEIDQLPLTQVSKGGFVTIKLKPRWLTWLNLDKVNYPEAYNVGFQKVI